MKIITTFFQAFFWICVLFGYLICFILVSPILLFDFIKSKKVIVIIFLLLTQISFAGHITKFTNTSTIFRSGELYQIYFIDKTEDFFGQNLKNMSYKWDFGDSQTSVETNPIHKYSSLGFYDIKLSVLDTSINFLSEYNKRINLQRFKDTCTTIIFDTISIQDTNTVTITDTIFITVIDTVFILGVSQYNLFDCVKGKFYDISGRFITNDFNSLPFGTYIMIGEGIKKKLFKGKR